jgi:hypothetical protein
VARTPLTLLVASPSNDQVASFLHELGARAFPWLNEQVLDIAKDTTSLLIVDAVVVDATSIIYFDGGILPRGDAPVNAAASLVRDILNLPHWAAMRNGVPWCDLPIFVLVDEPYYGRFAGTFPGNLPQVTVCKVPFRPYGWEDPYRLSFGWDKVYDLIVQRVKDWTFELVERMQLRGWSLTTVAGLGRKYRSTKGDYDMQRLAPTSITLVPGEKDRVLFTKIALVRWDHAIAHVVEHLGEASKYHRHVREYWFQRLYLQKTHIFSAQHRSSSFPTLI